MSVGIDEFILSSSGINAVDWTENEVSLKHSGDWVKMYCPDNYISMSYTKLKKFKKTSPSDWQRPEIKDFTLNPGMQKMHLNKEGDKYDDINIRITLVSYQTVETEIDPDTGSQTDTIINNLAGSGSTNTGPGGTDPDPDAETEPSNWGFYIFLFAILAMVLVGGYLWYKKKLPFQSDSIIEDIKEGEGED